MINFLINSVLRVHVSFTDFYTYTILCSALMFGEADMGETVQNRCL